MTASNSTTPQLAYAQYVGTAPSDIYDVAIEAQAIQSTYGSTTTPIVSATLAQEQPPKDTSMPPFSQALNSPTKATTPSTKNSHGTRPPKHGHNTTTTTATPFPSNTITGEEYLRLLKEDRKKRTVTSGFVGGAIGCIFLGPVGAVIGGTASAVITKKSRKRQERYLRDQLQQQGALDKPFVARIRRN